MNFLNRGWCAIYLILDEEALNQQEFKILAYFTLSHKTLIPEQASKTKVKTVTKGFQHAESIHFVLIGQLGKHIEKLPDGTFKGAAISSQEILDYAFEIIEESNELIPCGCVLIECSDEEKLHQIYKNYGFKFFQEDNDLFQFYKVL